MHQSAITLETYSEITEAWTYTGWTGAGHLTASTGIHPVLGSVLVIEDIASGFARAGAPAFIAFTDRPLALLDAESAHPDASPL